MENEIVVHSKCTSRSEEFFLLHVTVCFPFNAFVEWRHDRILSVNQPIQCICWLVEWRHDRILSDFLATKKLIKKVFLDRGLSDQDRQIENCYQFVLLCNDKMNKWRWFFLMQQFDCILRKVDHFILFLLLLSQVSTCNGVYHEVKFSEHESAYPIKLKTHIFNFHIVYKWSTGAWKQLQVFPQFHSIPFFCNFDVLIVYVSLNAK